MSDQNTIRPLSDEELASVSGGTTKDYRAAVDLMNGVYGSGADAQKAIGDLGLDYWSVQHMANALSQGYGRVAQDVIDGELTSCSMSMGSTPDGSRADYIWLDN